MKQKFLSALCLITICASSSGSLFAQGIGSKKRQISAPVVTAPANLATNISDASILTDPTNGAMLNWTTDFEIGTLGFNVYRVSADGVKQQINPNLIVGSIANQGDRLPEQSGANYRFYDENGSAGAMYYIETVSTMGVKQSYGPYAPVSVGDISKQLGYNRAQHDVFARQNSGLIESNIPASQAKLAKQSARSLDTTASSQETQKWVTAQPGAKIKVRNTGIYRVTRAQLQAGGFDVNSAQDNWQLYVDGVQQSMTVEPSGAISNFYGSGIDHPNTDSRIYYLVTGTQPGNRIAQGVRRPFSANVVSPGFRSVVHFEERFNYIPDIVNGDLDNWFGSIVTNSGSVSKNITVTDLQPDSGAADITVALHGFQYGDHSVVVKINGNTLENVAFNGKIPV